MELQRYLPGLEVLNLNNNALMRDLGTSVGTEHEMISVKLKTLSLAGCDVSSWEDIVIVLAGLNT